MGDFYLMLNNVGQIGHPGGVESSAEAAAIDWADVTGKIMEMDTFVADNLPQYHGNGGDVDKVADEVSVINELTSGSRTIRNGSANQNGWWAGEYLGLNRGVYYADFDSGIDFTGYTAFTVVISFMTSYPSHGPFKFSDSSFNRTDCPFTYHMNGDRVGIVVAGGSAQYHDVSVETRFDGPLIGVVTWDGAKITSRIYPQNGEGTVDSIEVNATDLGFDAADDIYVVDACQGSHAGTLGKCSVLNRAATNDEIAAGVTWAKYPTTTAYNTLFNFASADVSAPRDYGLSCAMDFRDVNKIWQDTDIYAWDYNGRTPATNGSDVKCVDSGLGTIHTHYFETDGVLVGWDSSKGLYQKNTNGYIFNKYQYNYTPYDTLYRDCGFTMAIRFETNTTTDGQCVMQWSNTTSSTTPSLRITQRTSSDRICVDIAGTERTSHALSGSGPFTLEIQYDPNGGASGRFSSRLDGGSTSTYDAALAQANHWYWLFFFSGASGMTSFDGWIRRFAVVPLPLFGETDDAKLRSWVEG